jgi:hypothetical protein
VSSKRRIVVDDVVVEQHDADDIDLGYATRVVQARCPEVADQVIEIDILTQVLELIAEMQDRQRG